MQVLPTPPALATAQGRADSADRLEQAFLEEMLKYCGPTSGNGAFSGGIGEEQFSSFLTQEWAGLLARKIDMGFSAMLKGKV